MNHPIHFVSLGPGDPELITLKGLKTLQKADIIFCHCNRLRLSLFPGGGLKGNRVRIPDRPRCCELLNIRTIPWPLVL